MKIERVRVRERSGPLVPAVRSAIGVWSERRSLVIEVFDEDGVCGLGEASPLPGFSRDTISGCRRALEAFSAFVDREHPAVDPVPPVRHEIERMLSRMSFVASARSARAPPAARFAIETAILDLAAQRLGVPVHRVLAPFRTDAAVLPVAHLLSPSSERSLVEDAERAIANGRRTLKVKIGADERSLARAKALLRGLRGDVLVRLDANQRLATSAGLLRRRLESLAPFAMEWVEEPAPFSVSLALESSPVKIALDESLLDAGRDDLARAAERDLARAVVLKPMALGGAYRCIAFAEIARSFGWKIVVSHLFDGPIAHAAASNLALALSESGSIAQGLDDHAGLASWGCRLRHGGVHVRAGFLGETAEPGLGFTREDRAALGGCK